MGIRFCNAQLNEQIVIGHKHIIKSEILSEEREYWVSLPNSYDAELLSYKAYPILVLLDGNVHFHSVSGMVNSLSSGNTDKREIPEMIVVAILNVSRERDFTPDKIITKRENQTGGGDTFLAFIESELIPKIESEYRTVPYRILVGHSLAGLLTTHSYLQEKSPFNSFISIDPSFGNWDEKTMDEKISNVKDDSFKRPLYLATANWGKRNLRNRDRHIRFYEAMKAKSSTSFYVEQKYYQNKNHSSVPFPAIYDGLSYIFKGYNQSYREVSNIEELNSNYYQLSQRNSYNFPPPEELVNRIAYRFLRSSEEKEKQKALNFFKLNVENFPNSYNVYDSLGDAQYQLGKEGDALKNFNKSLELNPNNTNAKEMISKITNTDANK